MRAVIKPVMRLLVMRLAEKLASEDTRPILSRRTMIHDWVVMSVGAYPQYLRDLLPAVLEHQFVQT